MMEYTDDRWHNAWLHWPDRQLIDCKYCNGIHPSNDICAGKWKAWGKDGEE